MQRSLAARDYGTVPQYLNLSVFYWFSLKFIQTELDFELIFFATVESAYFFHLKTWSSSFYKKESIPFNHWVLPLLSVFFSKNVTIQNDWLISLFLNIIWTAQQSIIIFFNFMLSQVDCICRTFFFLCSRFLKTYK